VGLTIVDLTQEQFDLLRTTEGWNIDEVPRKHWNKIPGIQRLDDTFAIMASGSFSDPSLMNNINNIVAGIDVLVHEKKPKIHIGESEGNAYHYVFQYTGNPERPYIMYGPFITEMVIPHWFNVTDLDNYWKTGE